MGAIRAVNRDLAAPALWTAFTTLDWTDALPGDVRDYLRYIHEQNAGCNELIRKECLDLGRILSVAGADAVVLKGATWLFEDGPARADRMMRDVDILVDRDWLDGARAALADAGYTPVPTIVAEKGHVHDGPVFRAGEPANVELHVEPTTRVRMLPAREILEKATAIAPGLRMPAPEHRIVHNVIHAQIVNGDHAGGVANLRDSLDLARLIDAFGAEVDWAGLSQRARSRGFFPQLSGAIHKAARFAGATLPPPFAGDSGGRRHAWRCGLQRQLPGVDGPLRKFGILVRALAWERDSYALGFEETRGLRAHFLVNLRRASRIGQAASRAISSRIHG